MKQIIMALMVTCLSSCFQQYYKTNTTSKIEAVMFEQFQKQNKVFIVHTPEGPFLLREIKLDKDVLTGEKTPLNSNYERYLNPDTTGANRYPKKEKDIALSEVHIYTNSSFDGKTEVNLAMNQIFRLDVYDKDMKAIRGSRALSIVGICTPVIAVVALGAIAASEFESNPITINLH
jgi:hypothetical protein